MCSQPVTRDAQPWGTPVPIGQMKKLRPGGGEMTCLNHAAGEWRCWDLALAWPYPKCGESALDTVGTLVTAGGQGVTGKAEVA